MMRQPTRREEERVQLYFNCPEKVEHIERMLKRVVGYKDIVFTFISIATSGRSTRIKVKFGRGWTGRGAEIRGVDYFYGGKKGIIVFITISSNAYMIYKCCLKSPEDKIHLDEPAEITYDWLLSPRTHEEIDEEDEETRAIRWCISEIADEILNWEEETLAEMEEALQGQID